MRRFGLCAAVLLLVALPCTARGAVVPATGTEAIAELMAGAPVGSCAHDPYTARCPRVQRLEVASSSDAGTPGSASATATAVEEPDDEWDGYIPLAGAAASGNIKPGYACALNVNYPYIVHWSDGNETARTRSAHQCRSGVGVTYQELNTSLVRYYYGNQTLDNDHDEWPAGVLQQTLAKYDCNHDYALKYTNDTLGYVVLRGVGYFLPKKKGKYRVCA